MAPLNVSRRRRRRRRASRWSESWWPVTTALGTSRGWERTCLGAVDAPSVALAPIQRRGWPSTEPADGEETARAGVKANLQRRRMFVLHHDLFEYARGHVSTCSRTRRRPRESRRRPDTGSPSQVALPLRGRAPPTAGRPVRARRPASDPRPSAPGCASPRAPPPGSGRDHHDDPHRLDDADHAATIRVTTTKVAVPSTPSRTRWRSPTAAGHPASRNPRHRSNRCFTIHRRSVTQPYAR